MKRYSFLVLTLALIMCASAVFAIFPGPAYKGYPNVLGDGLTSIKLEHGWVQGTDAWYHCFSTNNPKFAYSMGLTLAPKMSTISNGSGAAIVYIFTNANNTNQGPVFEGSPLNGVYSGVWQVMFVTWNAGQPQWIAKDALAAPGSFPGLPDATQATFSTTNPFAPYPATTIIDCSIFAVGPIGNPWRMPPVNVPGNYRYRIPQATFVNTATKYLTIPYWNVYCRDPKTTHICTRQVVIPDAYPAALANLIGANVGPVLAGFSSDPVAYAALGLFNVINWTQPPKVLLNQYPILCACPNDRDNYSPVDQFALLNRVSPGFAEVLIQSCEQIAAQEPTNLLSVLYPGYPVQTPVGWPPTDPLAWLYIVHAPVL